MLLSSMAFYYLSECCRDMLLITCITFFLTRQRPGESLFERPGNGITPEVFLFNENVRCECSPLSSGDVCPAKSLYEDVIVSVQATRESTKQLLQTNIFPGEILRYSDPV